MTSAVATTLGGWVPTVIGSTKVGTTGGTQATGILVMTQTGYNNITPNATTLYFIEE